MNMKWLRVVFDLRLGFDVAWRLAAGSLYTYVCKASVVGFSLLLFP